MKGEKCPTEKNEICVRLREEQGLIFFQFLYNDGRLKLYVHSKRIILRHPMWFFLVFYAVFSFSISPILDATEFTPLCGCAIYRSPSSLLITRHTWACTITAPGLRDTRLNEHNNIVVVVVAVLTNRVVKTHDFFCIFSPQIFSCFSLCRCR